MSFSEKSGVTVVPVEAPGSKPYSVHCGAGLLPTLGTKLRELSPTISPRVLVVADAAVVPLYAATVLDSVRESGFEPLLMTVPTGEGTKSFSQLEPILTALAEHRVDRAGAVIALGGGVVGDLAGFAAGIYQRGITLVQVPTTLLAMVDSSVGGKTGINLPRGKNLVGVFHQPSLVLADFDTLKTLSAREIAAGMAEVIKYGCIADRELLLLLQRGAVEDFTAIVPRCVAIKAEVVRQDPHEITGQRATLNFGHTLGHAIENAAGYGRLLHGEAVAIGMRAAAHLSASHCGLSSEKVLIIEQTIQTHGLPMTVNGLERETIRAALSLDKKAQAGKNQWVLLRDLGQTMLCRDVTLSEIEALLDLVLVDNKLDTAHAD